MGSATGLGMAILAGATGGFAGGFTGALLNGANLGQAFKAGAVGGITGAASGFLSFASGAVTSSGFTAVLDRAGKHAFSNTWLNGITGGSMKHGFITGALSSVGNGYINDKIGGLGYKVTASAVLGGTIESIGGGKFANGAITGAYGMMFNEIAHDLKSYIKKQFGEINGLGNVYSDGRVPKGYEDKYGYDKKARMYIKLSNGNRVPGWAAGKDIYISPSTMDSKSLDKFLVTGHEVLHVKHFVAGFSIDDHYAGFTEYAAWEYSNAVATKANDANWIRISKSQMNHYYTTEEKYRYTNFNMPLTPKL